MSLCQQLKFDIFDKNTKQKLDKDMSFVIDILDINDNAPAFENPQMTIDVKENTSEGGKPTDLPRVCPCPKMKF